MADVPATAPFSPTCPADAAGDLNSFRSSNRSNLGPQGPPSGLSECDVPDILRSWFAALAPPSAAEHASATITKAWCEAAQLPSLWAKASAVYNAAIALTLDPTGRLAAADGDLRSIPKASSLAEQLAATETALKHLISTHVVDSAPTSLKARVRPRQHHKSSVTSGSSLNNNSMNPSSAPAPPKKTKSAVFVDAAGKVGLWHVIRSRKKSLVANASMQRQTRKTRSPKATTTTHSAESSKHTTPKPLKPMVSGVDTTGSVRSQEAGSVRSQLLSEGDEWSDVESDAGGDVELPAVDLQVTRHLTGGMNDSDDSDADDPEVLGDLNQFTVLERLGRGAEGEVFLAMDTTKSELRAIKAVRRPVSNGLTRVSAAAKQKLDRIACEIAIMKRMRHRNVVTLHEVIDDPARDTMYFVLQYVEHGPIATLADDGTVSATVEPQRLVDYARQLCSGLQYLHSKGVIHRDIKPENILRGANDQVYLADFGVSENFDDATCDSRRIAGTRGTPAFLAPELLQLRSQRRHSLGSEGGSDDGEAAALPTDVDGAAVDVWALGITLYVLLYGKLPWEFSNAKDLFDEIQRRPIELRQPVSPGLSTTSVANSPYILPSPICGGGSFGGSRRHSLVHPGMPPAVVVACSRAANGGADDEDTHGGLSPFSDHQGQQQPNASASSGPAVSVGRLRPSSATSPARGGGGSGLIEFSVPHQPMPEFAAGDLSVAECSACGGDDDDDDDEDSAMIPVPPLPSMGGVAGVRRHTAASAASPLYTPPQQPRTASVSPGAQSLGMSVANLSMTGPMARSFLPSVVMASNAADGWRRVLFGMLQRDPRKRSSLATVRKQLQQLSGKLEQASFGASTPNIASAFTVLQQPPVTPPPAAVPL